jgi:hypothetical protein
MYHYLSKRHKRFQAVPLIRGYVTSTFPLFRKVRACLLMNHSLMIQHTVYALSYAILNPFLLFWIGRTGPTFLHYESIVSHK